MIRHVVIWTFTPEDPVDRDRLAAEIETRLLALPDVIPEIRTMTLHRDAAGFDLNADLMLDSTFDDLEALQRYIAHPQHREVAAYIDANVRGRAVADVEV